MDDKVMGAWIIHHAKKAQELISTNCDAIVTAGKAGSLLSTISSTNDRVITADALKTYSRDNNINAISELPYLLGHLESQKLIEKNSNGDIKSIGLTSSSVLIHTAQFFKTLSHQKQELALLQIAERSSEFPTLSTEITEFVGDELKISKADMHKAIETARDYSFVDSVKTDTGQLLLFNGNLFRKDNPGKLANITIGLKDFEKRLISDINARFNESIVLTMQETVRILGQDLFDKLVAIGYFDINKVSNEIESTNYITLPSAFQKYGDSSTEDAFDLVKAFVSSITYGITSSSPSRGRIMLPTRLIQSLMSGQWVGPATAIGQDYKILELKGVIEVQRIDGNRFNMRLLKMEVGELALRAMESFDISEYSVSPLTGVNVSMYDGPERNRHPVRRKCMTREGDLLDMLRTIRK